MIKSGLRKGLLNYEIYNIMFHIMREREEREIKRRKPLEKRKVKNINMRLTQADYDALINHFGSGRNIRSYLLELVKKHECS